MSLDGNQLAVGAPSDDGGGAGSSGDSGAVYLFSFSDGLFSDPLLESTIGENYNFGKNIDITLDTSDRFGRSVSLDSNRLAAGAERDDGVSDVTTDAGAVHLFSFDDAVFTGGKHLGTIGSGYASTTDAQGFSTDGVLEATDALGQSISLDGTRLAVGAPFDDGFENSLFNAGAVHLFTFTDTDFNGGNLESTIGAGYGGGKNFDLTHLLGLEGFGTGVSLDGTRLAVGTPGDDGFGAGNPDSGAVYLLSFSDSVFSDPTLEATIGSGYPGAKDIDLSAVLDDADAFGTDVSLDGTRLVVSAPEDAGAGDTVAMGAAHLFTFTDNVFSGGVHEGTIGAGYVGPKDLDLAAAIDAGDQFGSGVSLDGDALVIGAASDDGASNANTDSGAVYLINFTDAVFNGATHEGTLGVGYVGAKDLDLAGIVDNTDNLGESVSLDGAQLAVGAPTDDGAGNTAANAGAVHLFSFTDTVFNGGSLDLTIGSGYTGAAGLDVAGLEALDQLGSSVSIDAGRIAAGASSDDGFGNTAFDAGGAYFFTLAGTDPLTASFGDQSSSSVTIETADLATQNVSLQANNDFTVLDPVVVTAGGAGGNLDIEAGRSVLFNADITTDNGNLTVIANRGLASGTIDAERDAGAAEITMADGVTIDAGGGTIVMRLESDLGKTDNTSGDITLENLIAADIQIDQQGATAGSDILRASADALIQANSAHFNVVGAGGGGSIGTLAEPLLISGFSPILLNATSQSGGVFFSSATDVVIGGSLFGAGSGLTSDGELVLQATGGIQVNEAVDSTNDMTLTASGANLDINGVAVTTPAFQTVSVTGAGLRILGGGLATDDAFLQATTGQDIDALFIDVVSGAGDARINTLFFGTQDIDTTGTGGIGQGLLVDAAGGGIASVSSGGTQTIDLLDADLLRVVGSIGDADITSTLTQTITVTGSGNNTIEVGAITADGESIISGNQTITAGTGAETGAIIMRAGDTADADASFASAAGLTIATTGSLDMLGGTGDAADVELDAVGLIDLDIGGNLRMVGGSADDSQAEIESSAGALDINVLGLALLGGGAGDDTEGDTGSQAQLSVQTSLDLVIAGNLTMVAGTGDGADADIESLTGAMTVNVGGILSMTGGDGPDADAELDAEGALDLDVGADLLLVGGGGFDGIAQIESKASNTDIDVVGLISLIGGTGDDAKAELDMDTASVMNVTAGTTITMIGGSGDNADADIDGTAGSTINITAGAPILIMGGGGIDADAEISGSTINIDTTGTIIMTGGTNTDAYASIGDAGFTSTIVIGDGAAIGGSITLTGGTATGTFAGIGDSCAPGACGADITINTNGGLTLDSVAGEAFVGSLNIGAGPVTVNAGLLGPGDIALNDGNVKASGSVLLSTGNGGISQAGGMITTTNLALSATGTIDVLTTASLVAAESTVAGDVTIDNIGAMTVGASGGVTGITTTASNITLSADDTITITEAITAGGTGDVFITSTGAASDIIKSSPSSLISAANLALDTTGTINVDTAVSLVAAQSTVAGDITINNTGNLDINTFGGITGVSTTASAATVRSDASLTVTSPPAATARC